jgi:hypothetical protein
MVGISVGTDIDNSKKRNVEKSGIDIKIIGGAHFSSIVGKKVLNWQLLKIALSAMVIMGSIGQKGGFNLVIRVYLSVSRSEAEHQYMIGWGADLVYMKGLVNTLDIFQGIKRSLRTWQTQEFQMKKYSTGTLIYAV